MVAREEIFDGTMQQLFAFVTSELASAGPDKRVDQILSSIPAPYFELYLLYRHHIGIPIGRNTDISPAKESAALSAVSAYLDWRQKLQLQYNPMQAKDVLGGSIGALEMYALMPECALGHDKAGHPVVYFLWTRSQPDDVNNIVRIMNTVTTKNIFDYHLWQHEALVELCYQRSRVGNCLISSCTLVLDLELLTTENASSEFLHIASRRADLLHQFFPYLVSKILVVNATDTDTRLIHHVRTLCNTISPSAEVFFSNSEKNPFEMLSQHIDPSELPAEYGGSHQFSLATLPHPFWETERLRGREAVTSGGGGGRVSPLLSLHLSLPTASSSVPLPPIPQQQLLTPTGKNDISSSTSPTLNSAPLPSSRTTEASSATLLLQVDDEDSLYSPPSFTHSYLASVDSQSTRTFSSSSSKIPNSVIARPLSLSSAGAGSGIGMTAGLSKADDVLTAIPMTPNARVALTAFIELFASNDIPITPANMQSGGIDGGCSDGQREGDNVVLTTVIDPVVLSVIRDGATAVSVGCELSTKLDFMRNISTSFFDTVAIKTSSGVAILQKRQGDRRKLAVCGVDIDDAEISGNDSGDIESNDSRDPPVLPFCCRKYMGSFALASGRVYILSRGVSLSGWLQKWPMKSQGLGGATQRYFVLSSHSLRYWKTVPHAAVTQGRSESRDGVTSANATADDENDDSSSHMQGAATTAAELEPPKGQFTLTHETVIKRSKTLFGNSTIELKSTDDVLTICAYSSAEDTAWYSELFNAIEKLKKAHREKLDGSERNFPELTWRSPEPSCVAVNVDVFDPTIVEDQERSFRSNSAQETGDAKDSSGTAFGGTYAVLCRIKNGLSTVHSVQIGPNRHVPLRLENSDLDMGVQLTTVRLCGDCLIVSGSHGFVGSGRIPPSNGPAEGAAYLDNISPSRGVGDSSSNTSTNPVQRIYVRRMVNCFHGEDAHVTSLAVPRILVISKSNSKSKHYMSPVKGGGSPQSFAANILASGDEIGGVCVWRREEGGRGVVHYPTYDGQQSKNKHRAGYSWQCVHRARIGHKVTDLSFSPCGKILAATTPERALLFDISQLLVDATHTPDRRTRSEESTEDDVFAIRSVVLDDLVGCPFSNCSLLYGVDLSSPGWVKLWKVSSGSDEKKGMQKGDKIQFMESKLEPLFDRLRDVRHVKPLRQLFPNAVAAPPPTTTGYTGKSLDRGSHGRKLISLSQDSEVDYSTIMKNESMVSNLGTETTDSLSVNERLPFKDSPPDVVESSTDSRSTPVYISNHERDGTVLDGYSVDPFYYSDLCVIDPVRMHLRDWWCDYSSRYLLLGHARLSSLSTFETTIISSSPQTAVAGSLSSLSRSLHDSASLRVSEGGHGTHTGEDVPFLEAGRGLDRQSTTMFWSTLTNSLGRRVVCRYYVPNGYYQRLRESWSSEQLSSAPSSIGMSNRNIAPILEDCLRFCLTISRCLYECLGDEYTHSLLISWKSAALDSAREILERKSHTVFKDISIFQDILKRFELSPDLALSSLNDLIAVMENIKQWQAAQPRQANVSHESGVLSSLTSPLTSSYVEAFFKSLRDTLSVVYDEQGLQSVIPSSRMIYLRNGGVPPLNSANFQQVVEDYMAALLKLDTHSGICSIIHLMQSLVIDPLNHFERTEPFAVALCVVGLKGVPAYVNDVVLTQADSGNSPTGPGAHDMSPSLSKSGLEGVASPPPSVHRPAEMSAVHKDISIEYLISKIAKDTPPWIRFVLTSDTDKVVNFEAT